MNQPRGLLKLLKLDSLLHTLIDYFETRVDLIKAEAKDNLLVALRAAAIYGSIAVLGLFFVIFLSITIALVLNALLNSTFWGFVIVTGIYLAALITLYSLRNSEKVKMMFGDGSLAFLKMDRREEEKKEREEEARKRKEDIRRIAAIRQKEAEAATADGQENGQENGQKAAASNAGAASRKDRPATIRVEKK